MPSSTPAPFPAAAALACWLDAVLTGRAGTDELEDAVRGEDAAHVVTGLAEQPLSLADAVAPLVTRGLTAATPALPVPGDPLGLAGPAAFTTTALESGEAVVLHGTGLGLVPVPDTRVVRWWAMPAEPGRVEEGPAEAGAVLRRALVETTHALVDLDVARWQPEIPDLLANLRHRRPLWLPRGLNPAHVDTLERARLCRQIVALARADGDGGALTGSEATARHRLLGDLDRAARRALVACCGTLVFDAR